MKDYEYPDKTKNTKVIWAHKLALDLLQTIQFADKIYSLYDFIGTVRIILRVMNPLNSKIYIGDHFPMSGFRNAIPKRYTSKESGTRGD